MDYLSVLRSRWLVVVTVTALALAVGVLASLRTARTYVAQSRVFFSVGVGTSASDLARGFSYTQGLVRSYAKVATQPVVLQPVIDQLGLRTSPDQLARSVTAQSPLETVLLEIEVSDRDPQRAAAIANAVAAQLPQALNELTPPSGGRTPAKITTVAQAYVPTQAAAPRTRLNLVVATLIGLLLGAVAAVARDALDRRIHRAKDVSQVTSAPVIGMAAADAPRRRWRPGRAAVAGAGGVDRQPGRVQQLRTNFEHLTADRSLTSVVFTSAVVEGPTVSTVSELALALARRGVRTLLIDADMRTPGLAARHQLPNDPGLSSVLDGRMGWHYAVRRTAVPDLSLLPAGPRPPDPTVLLQSQIMDRLVLQAAAEYEVVLIKAPPVLRLADSLLLSRHADGVVVVTDQPGMSRDTFVEEVRTLEAAGANVLGVVLAS